MAQNSHSAGGLARAAKLTKEQRSAIASTASKARWAADKTRELRRRSRATAAQQAIGHTLDKLGVTA